MAPSNTLYNQLFYGVPFVPQNSICANFVTFTNVILQQMSSYIYKCEAIFINVSESFIHVYTQLLWSPFVHADVHTLGAVSNISKSCVSIIIIKLDHVSSSGHIIFCLHREYNAYIL